MIRNADLRLGKSNGCRNSDAQQIFKNKEGSEGILYLISNDVKLDKQSIETSYQKVWNVELSHKKIKFKYRDNQITYVNKTGTD